MINDYKLDVSFSELINTYISKHPDGDRAGVKRAWQYANEKHRGVKRGSGEPYINHPLRVARILAVQGFESEYLMAALLHDVVEDCDVPLSEIRDLFGNTVREHIYMILIFINDSVVRYLKTELCMKKSQTSRLCLRRSSNATFLAIVCIKPLPSPLRWSNLLTCASRTKVSATQSSAS